jgi:hypothetical protein
MSPLRTQKKRSPGRPKENKLIRELKVKTWFAAVAEASGKTAYELEKEFAPSYVDREEFGKHRARLWDKYRLGKSMPTFKEKQGGRRPIALLVEDSYPGTLQWLISPMWQVLDLEIEITMMDLRVIYESLPAELSGFIIEENRTGKFWRKGMDSSIPLISMLTDQESIEAATAVVCLWRESLISQQKNLYDAIFLTIKQWLNSKPIRAHLQSIALVIMKYN